MTDLTDRATLFAAKAHAFQTRKYTGLPYVTHTVEVMTLVRHVGGILDEHVLAAAVLHDVVEDTSYGLDDIEKEFGYMVSRYVYGLTDQFTDTKLHGNRATRKARERERLANEIHEVQSIKLADMISNTASIAAFDRDFAKVYLREKRDLLRVLDRGNVRLQGAALQTLEAAEKALKGGS